MARTIAPSEKFYNLFDRLEAKMDSAELHRDKAKEAYEAGNLRGATEHFLKADALHEGIAKKMFRLRNPVGGNAMRIAGTGMMGVAGFGAGNRLYDWLGPRYNTETVHGWLSNLNDRAGYILFGVGTFMIGGGLLSHKVANVYEKSLRDRAAKYDDRVKSVSADLLHLRDRLTEKGTLSSLPAKQRERFSPGSMFHIKIGRPKK